MLIILILIIVVLVACIFTYEDEWSKPPFIVQECTLIGSSYIASTRETDLSPVFTGNGLGVGVVSSGHGEEYITVWDCGQYGRLKSDDEELFKFAKEKSTLRLKEINGEVRIIGIEK